MIRWLREKFCPPPAPPDPRIVWCGVCGEMRLHRTVIADRVECMVCGAHGR